MPPAAHDARELRASGPWALAATAAGSPDLAAWSRRHDLEVLRGLADHIRTAGRESLALGRFEWADTWPRSETDFVDPCFVPLLRCSSAALGLHLHHAETPPVVYLSHAVDSPLLWVTESLQTLDAMLDAAAAAPRNKTQAADAQRGLAMPSAFAAVDALHTKDVSRLDEERRLVAALIRAPDVGVMDALAAIYTERGWSYASASLALQRTTVVPFSR